MNSEAAAAYFARNPEMAKNTILTKPTRRVGEAEPDVGPVAVMLSSDDCQHMTGVTLFVDGGAHITGFTPMDKPQGE